MFTAVLWVVQSHQILIVCLFSLRYSHGEVVNVSELRNFLEADLTNLQQGSSCLAKHEDGIWYPAKITGTTAHSSCQSFQRVISSKKKKKRTVNCYFLFFGKLVYLFYAVILEEVLNHQGWCETSDYLQQIHAVTFDLVCTIIPLPHSHLYFYLFYFFSPYSYSCWTTCYGSIHLADCDHRQSCIAVEFTFMFSLTNSGSFTVICPSDVLRIYSKCVWLWDHHHRLQGIEFDTCWILQHCELFDSITFQSIFSALIRRILLIKDAQMKKTKITSLACVNDGFVAWYSISLADEDRQWTYWTPTFLHKVNVSFHCKTATIRNWVGKCPDLGSLDS